jgi:hypothetical protein
MSMTMNMRFEMFFHSIFKGVYVFYVLTSMLYMEDFICMRWRWISVMVLLYDEVENVFNNIELYLLCCIQM